MAEEEENKSYNEGEETEERRPHIGGRVLRIEPSSTRELLASPLNVTCFKYVGYYDFCEEIQRVENHPMLTILFISGLHDNHITLATVTFTISTSIISATLVSQMLGRSHSRKVIWRRRTLNFRSNEDTRM